MTDCGAPQKQTAKACTCLARGNGDIATQIALLIKVCKGGVLEHCRPPHFLEKWNKLHRGPWLHHIDLFVGGMAETLYNGGLMGRTFQAIIGMNFRGPKNGDRFFFSHEANMNKDRYDYVMDRTLGDIICDNSKYISHVRENVFLSNSPIKACACKEKEIPESKKVFLALW